MRFVKIALALIGVALVAVQFVRPPKNQSPQMPGEGIDARFPVPPHIMQVFKRSCYDCHSDSTVYPWYAQIQPLGWWLNSHIEKGKRGINFDRFSTYRPMRQYAKFRDIVEQLQKDEMPIGSYLLIHRYARLGAEEKEEIITWSGAMMDSMKTRYPADSLQRRRTETRAPR
ncbi:MAG TPA: heme-binding domain-containing protein [Bacteroidota bacterium]|nr:heme-binding domain-containing protein [Bacteroidota bacterium]